MITKNLGLPYCKLSLYIINLKCKCSPKEWIKGLLFFSFNQNMLWVLNIRTISLRHCNWYSQQMWWKCTWYLVEAHLRGSFNMSLNPQNTIPVLNILSDTPLILFFDTSSLMWYNVQEAKNQIFVFAVAYLFTLILPIQIFLVVILDSNVFLFFTFFSIPIT